MVVQRKIVGLVFSAVILCMPITVKAMGDMPPAQEYPAAGYQEYPSEEYIPEGDYTPPPPLAIQEPEMVVVPSGNTYVYMLPNMSGVYFYNGYWYRYHHGVWFRSNIYNGAWVYVDPQYVPRYVVDIPPAYSLYLPGNYYRIHYYDFHRSWRTWDRDRHWQKERWFQQERRADIRRDRIRQANVRMEQDRRMRDQRIRERSLQKPQVQPRTLQKPQAQPRTLQQPQAQPRTLQQQQVQPRTLQQQQVQPRTLQKPQVQPRTLQKQQAQPRTLQKQQVQPRTLQKPQVQQQKPQAQQKPLKAPEKKKEPENMR